MSYLTDYFRTVVLAGTAIVLALAAAAAPAYANDDKLVDDYRGAYGPPGVAAAVIDGPNTKTIVRGRDGAGRPVTPNTRFRIASTTKSMTSAAIMLLVQRGRFALDDPVVKVLPEFRMADPRYRKITVRQLLSHTSGMSIKTYNEYPVSPPRSAKELVARLADKRLANEPGTTYQYYNTNYEIAARIIEVTSNGSFQEFVEQNLFKPLGMTETDITTQCTDSAAGLTSGYLVVLGMAIKASEMPGLCLAEGGAVSTLSDMVRWVRFQQGGSGSDLLSDAALAELKRPQPNAEDYALGWKERRADKGAKPTTLIGHGGSMPTFSSDMVFDRKSGVGAIVLTNNGGGKPSELTENLIAVRSGQPITSYSNPLTLVNVVVAFLIVLLGTLLIFAIVRAPRWAAARRAGRRPLVALRLVPLVAIVLAGCFAGTLLGPGLGFASAWMMTAWLMPLIVVLALVCVLLGSAALGRRLWAWFRRPAGAVAT